MTIARLLHISATLLLSLPLLLSSCSSHEPGGGHYGADTTFGLSLGVSADAYSATSGELISSWWVGFYSTSGTLVDSRVGSLSRAVEEDRFDITLPAGDYTVIAVANQDAPAAFPALSTDTWTPSLTAEGCWTGANVPMTGHRTIHVNERGGQQFDVEVVRKVAKFEVQFTNAAQHPVTLLGYTIHALTGTTVWEWPQYSTLAHAPVPAGTSTRDVTRTLAQTLDVSDKSDSSDLSDVFYTLESLAPADPHGVYAMTLRLRHGDGPEVEAHALITTLSHVNRNDYIVLPVQLTDYIITVRCLFYPPIGGFPAKVEEDDQNNYTVTFGGPGDFSLVPSVREAVSGAAPLVIADLNPQLTVDDPEGIFDTVPAFDSASGEIVGVIGSTQGRATLTLTLTIPSRAVGGADFVVTRKFLVIRS